MLLHTHTHTYIYIMFRDEKHKVFRGWFYSEKYLSTFNVSVLRAIKVIQWKKQQQKKKKQTKKNKQTFNGSKYFYK